jgi:signal peptidase II
MKKYLSYIILASIIVIGLVVDLVTKSIFASMLEYGKETIVLIPNLLEFVYVENDGAAYGMMGGHTWFLIVLTILFIVGFVLYFIFNKDKNIWFTVGVGLIVSGAIGNLIDRIIFNFVRDFISMEFFNFIFNFADMFITFGVIFFVISMIFDAVKEVKEKREKENYNETNDK